MNCRAHPGRSVTREGYAGDWSKSTKILWTDRVFVRGRDDAHYRPFTADDEAALHASFEHYERERFWDL